MKPCLRILILGVAWPILGAAGNSSTDMPRVDPFEVASSAQGDAKLPDVIGGGGGAAYRGPRIFIRVNDDPYVDIALRDSEEVSANQLGNYLARIPFGDTKKVRIRIDKDDPKKGSLVGKFELRLAVNRDPPGPDVLRISFDDMQFTRKQADPAPGF